MTNNKKMWYYNHAKLTKYIKIIFLTVKKVVSHADITDATQGTEDSSGKKVHDALDIERRTSDVK